jgi:tetratricopeptide (TPR) repeat protein
VEASEDVPRLHLDLGALPPSAIQRLASHVLGGEISARVAGHLADKTNGNPFFVEQLVLDLRERGALAQDARGLWASARKHMVEVPTSIGAVLVARVDRLAARVKAIVQTAAVLGREFEIDVLSRMLKDDTGVMAKVKRAEDEAIWSVLDEIRYVFRHALLRDAAYDMQLRARLRQLHALAGSAIEEVYAADLPPHYVDLAYHYRRAEMGNRERTYARLAGEHALAVGSYREALDLLERTLELVPDDAESQRVALLKLVGDVHFNQGAYPLAGEYFRDSLELAERTGDEAGGARARQGLGSIAANTGDYTAARDCFEQNLAAFHELDDRKGIADSIRHMGLAIQRLGDNPKARELFDQSLAIHRDIEDEKGVTSSLISLGDAIFRQGDYAAAGAHWEEALAICRRRNDRLAAATALNNLGNAATELGDISRAQACFEESLAIRREIGDREGTAASLNNLAYLPYTRGDYEAAQQYVQQSLEVSREVGKPHIIAMNLNNLGMFADLQGQYSEARSYYEEGLAIARRTGDSWNIAQNLCGLGSVALRLDDIPQAEKSFREVLGIAQKGRASSLALEALSGFARLYRQVGRTTESAELLELVDRHPATAVDVKQNVLKPLRSALEKELAPDHLAAALERGRSLDLDAEVSAILSSDDESRA